jgi:TRAP-type mannitol/chloroaromatic compound transport system permease small subunit
MTDAGLARLLWQLLGGVILPLWLLSGLADYIVHARTRIALTSGVKESAMHLLQTAEIGVPMLAVLFLQANAAVLALAAAGVLAHSATSWCDVRYAIVRRHVPVFEQFVHGLLFVLPFVALALLVVLHWPAARALASPLHAADGSWSLHWRDPPFAPGMVVAVLGASVLLGVLPGLVEFARTFAARRSPRVPPRVNEA